LEILVSIAIIGVSFATLLSIGTQAINFSYYARNMTDIDFLVREEMEALRTFRDNTDWDVSGLGTVSTGGAPYHLYLDTGASPAQWTLVGGTETVGNFLRNVVFEKVSRDPGTNDVESTYNILNEDLNTRKATVNIIWEGKVYQVITYLANWQ